jgi:hypothetical protein
LCTVSSPGTSYCRESFGDRYPSCEPDELASSFEVCLNEQFCNTDEDCPVGQTCETDIEQHVFGAEEYEGVCSTFYSSVPKDE